MVIKCWLLSAIIVTGLSWLAYLLVQQDLRSSANDPQIQIAEDIAAQLTAGQSAQSLVAAQQVDIARSLDTYVIIVDNTDTPLASSARLNNQTPLLPPGIFDYVRQNGEDRITWQPQSGIRSAIVVTRFQGSSSGFVIVGRSLREVEQRESDFMHITLLGWLGILVVSGMAGAILFNGQHERVRI